MLHTNVRHFAIVDRVGFARRDAHHGFTNIGGLERALFAEKLNRLRSTLAPKVR